MSVGGNRIGQIARKGWLPRAAVAASAPSSRRAPGLRSWGQARRGQVRTPGWWVLPPGHGAGSGPRAVRVPPPPPRRLAGGRPSTARRRRRPPVAPGRPWAAKDEALISSSGRGRRGDGKSKSAHLAFEVRESSPPRVLPPPRPAPAFFLALFLFLLRLVSVLQDGLCPRRDPCWEQQRRLVRGRG